MSTFPSKRSLLVAMVIQSYPPVLGGAQRQIQRLGPLLASRGIRPVVVTRRPPGAVSRELDGAVYVRRLTVPAASGAASLAYVAQGTATVVGLRPDVIHVFDLLSPATIGLAAAAALRAPIVAKVLSAGVGGDVDRLLHKPLGARRLRLIARRFAAFNTLTTEVEDELNAHGVPRERMIRISNGVDARHFRPALDDDERGHIRRMFGIPAGAVIALYCGRFAPVKRLDVLIEAFRGLRAHLVLVGEGPDEERAKRLAAPLAGRVHFLATVDDPASLYRAADLYVSASLTEGMSGSVLEAMSSGLPVAASPASGMSQLLGAGAGRIAQGGDAPALEQAAGALVEDPALRAALGSEARALVAREYSLESTADALADLYRALAEK